jgi:hypothetical protein
MISPGLRQAARTLRNVRLAQADGGTWAQIAPLLGCADARTAKARAHALERRLRPVAAQMVAARRVAAELIPDEPGGYCPLEDPAS